MPKQIMALAVLLLPVSCVTFGPTHVIVDNDKPWSPPPLTRSVSVQDGTTGEIIPFERFLDRLAKVDAVFVGETHTDETTHRVELAVYDGLLRRRAGKVVLAMEMFERDVQAQLDAYISGEIDEAMFLAHARPWSNYRAAYRPMIELARAHRRPVVASNFPRPLLRQIAMGGEDSYGDAVAEAGHRQLPTKLFPNTDAYWRRVDNAIRSHRAMIAARGGMGNRLLSTQCLWDNAMGEACAYALDDHPGHTVVHVNGAFHSAYWDGTVRQFQLRKPDAKVATVAVVSVGNPGVADVGGAPVADYVVFAEARATDVNEGKWSVYVDRELEYVLSLPEHPFDKEALPLLIWLSDDGWTTDEGLALWQKRLGNEAAIAVLKAPYPQTGADLGGGGRWFWPDTFPADVSTMIVACERAWAYILRHYPIDPARVCLAGEGTGATVASSIALLTDRMDLRAIAMSPRQYAKIKDFPLPLPEFQGDAEPPTRTLHVWGSEEDQAWWSDELAEYGEVGMDSEMVLATTDPWQMQREAENMVRAALGLKQTRTPKAAAYYHILVNDDSRRARRWARLAALKFEADGGACVAVVDHEPEGVASTAIPATVRAESFASEDALPECPGPFGGTTVVVVPEGGEERALEHWVTVEEDDPLAKQSRFHRLRVATMDANHERGLPHVLSDLLEARRKNVLIVPALYCADAGMMQRLQRMVREFEDRMTIQWMPGLGGRDAALSIDTDGAAQGHVFHTLSVEVDPATHTLAVDALIDLPKAWTSAGTEFVLNEALYVVSSKPAVTELGPDGEGDVRYALAEDATDGTLQMTYNGKINYELSDEKEQYTRGFRQTRGLISDEGIYLSLGTTWVPYFDARMIRFSLDVTLPSGWHIISQGDGTSRDDAGHARWHSSSLVEQVFMVGGPLVRISESTGTVESLVFLHEPDDALARRYLDATAMYIEMYRQLIGPYPYSKFALVENFWETGYGMPSFTVLGPTVIRLPFIVHSSYPHEILHNWWGNSVFVDYEHGNWCEGLTAYMADHLMKEQRGKGHEYRRNTLQKYRDYVNEGRDFPLVEFTSRHNAATEAVGYGKSLMMYHMLRRQLGDEAFKEATAELYRKHRGDRVTFADLEAVFEATSGDDLSRFFDQWVNRAGAPQLAVKDVIFGADSNSIHVTGVLEQTQSGAPYTLQVPLMVVTDNGPNWCRVDMTDRRQTFTCEVALTEGSQAMPVMLAVDPMFDVFRTLDPRETPPSIGQLFGEPEILAVLPGASPDETDLYRSLMASWASDEHHIETVFDSEINALPHDRAVWVLGKTNRFVSSVLESPLGDALTLGDEEVAVSGHTFVVVARHPENIEKAVGWICVEPPAAADGLIRKLPHYGKYSYLAFEGDEPTNIAKGQQSTDGSPMVVDLRGDTTTPPAAGTGRRSRATRRSACRLLAESAYRSRQLAGSTGSTGAGPGQQRPGAVGGLHRQAYGSRGSDTGR